MTTKIALVGEAWGEYEERTRTPFAGPSGYELTRMLDEAGIHRADCFLTNCFNLRPKPTNDIENLCQKDRTTRPSLKAGKYLRPEYDNELVRLYGEIRDLKPNIVVLLGGTATWAFTGSSAITKVRGTVASSTYGLPGIKILPTFHPAAVLREWSHRPVTVLDFAKAKREAEFPEIRRPKRTVYIEPTLADIEWFINEHLIPADQIIFDIETSGNQITCIGFAPSPYVALTIPFCDPRRPGGSYWSTPAEEKMAWDCVRRILRLPQRKAGQNTLYDINFLWKGYGIDVVNYTDDTMLLHHALQPECEKGLGFLGSVYTNEASWKLMRARGKNTIKRDD